MSEGPLDQLKAELVQDRGLPDGAVSFLSGSSVAELEASADALIKVLGSHVQPAPEASANPFTTARAAKAERQRALLAAFIGRSGQPRDAGERYARSGFDGGARQPVPAPRDAEREHSELVSLLAYQSKLGHGDF